MPKTLTAFADIEDLLNKALAGEGGKIEFTTPAKAVRWRFRAYRFRNLFRIMNYELHKDSASAEERAYATITPWDSIVIYVDGTTVTMTVGERFEAVFTPTNPIAPIDEAGYNDMDGEIS